MNAYYVPCTVSNPLCRLFNSHKNFMRVGTIINVLFFSVAIVPVIEHEYLWNE